MEDLAYVDRTIDRVNRDIAELKRQRTDLEARRVQLIAKSETVDVPSSASLAAIIDEFDRKAKERRDAFNAACKEAPARELPVLLALLNDPNGWKCWGIDTGGQWRYEKVIDDRTFAHTTLIALDDTNGAFMAGGRLGMFVVSRGAPEGQALLAELDRRQQEINTRLVARMPDALTAYVRVLLCDLKRCEDNPKRLREWFFTDHDVSIDGDEPCEFPIWLWNAQVRGVLAQELSKHFSPEHFDVVVSVRNNSVRITRREGADK